MKGTRFSHALFYPFHLCHEETLMRLLRRFHAIHFRDFMALQLTPMSGMTASADRMGDGFPELLAEGRLVQGYNVSGPLPAAISRAIDCDLRDERWRSLFHAAIQKDRRFQRGLFEASQTVGFSDGRLATRPFSVQRVRKRSAIRSQDERLFDYGLALVKTSAALVYTAQLATAHRLEAATDSPAHFALFERSRHREGWDIPNHLLVRKGY